MRRVEVETGGGIIAHPLKAHLDLFCCAVVALFLLLLIFALPGALLPLRSSLSFVFLLLIPGYLTAAVLFPRHEDIDGVERLALSIGLSVAAVPFVGLLLNYTPWGISLHSLSLGLTGFIGIMVLAALRRRQHIPSSVRFYSARSAGVLRRNLLLLGTVLLIGAGVVVTAQTLRPPRDVTEFYLLGQKGRLKDLPSALRPGQAFVVTLGVGHHGQKEAYRIHVPFAGSAGDIVLPQLKDGEVWQRSLTLRAPSGSGQKLLVFELYQSGKPKPYRTLQHYVSLGAPSRGSVAMCPGGQQC